MTPKSLLATALLSLAVTSCSSDASVSTNVQVTPTTAAEQVTSTTVAEVSSTTAVTTTEVPPTTTTTTTVVVPEVLELDISYVSGAVEGGGRIEVPLGDPVVIRINSDVAGEGHLHGYDIFVDLEPGNPGVIEFVADIPGIFELELEGAGVLLADLEVAP